MHQTQMRSPKDIKAYRSFKVVNSTLAATMDQVCCLKPEVALLIELYEAEGEGRHLSASSLGLTSGIAPTTTIRYVRYLEQQGWITRVPHEHDQRIVYVRLQPAMSAKLDKVFRD